MIIGVPTEIKTDEYRVAMLPVGAQELIERGHQVIVQAGAGLGSGLPDHEYLRAGAEMVASGADVSRMMPADVSMPPRRLPWTRRSSGGR